MTEHSLPLQQKFAVTRRWWRTTRAVAGSAWIVGIVVALGLACFHFDRVLVLSSRARELWLAGIAGAACVVALLALVRPLLRPLPDKVLAEDVERRYPALKERLMTTVDLLPAFAGSSASSSLMSGGFSRSMASALAAETVRVSRDLDFRRAVDTRSVRLAVMTAAFTLILLLLHVVLAPGAFAVWLERMAKPRADIAPYAMTRVWLTPGAEILPRGEGLIVTITTKGSYAERSTLRYRTEDENANTWHTVDLINGHAVKDGRSFAYRFPSVSQNLEMTATANDGRSNLRQVTVEDRPTILNVRMTLRYPAYTRRGVQVVSESTGNVAAPVGTEVELQAMANKPLRRAEIVWPGDQVGAWKVDGKSASGSMMVRRDESYALKLTDLHGFGNPGAPRYDVHAIKDTPPSVQVLRPGADIDLVPDGSLPLVARATDDYGVAAMRLNYNGVRGEGAETRTSGVKTIARGSVPLPGPDGKPQANVSQRWLIREVHARPGDVIRYDVDATDTDTISGPHTAHSLTYRVHVVALVEMQRRLKELLDEETRGLAQLRQRQNEAQQALLKARQKPNESNLGQAQEKQRNAAQEAQTLSQRVGDLTNQLENNNLASESELKRRDDAEKLLRDAGQQKMPAAADMIQRAQPSSRQSLGQAERKEEEVRKDIAQAQQLLARTPPPKQLADEAARLAQEQQRLADSSRALAEDMRALRNANNGLTEAQKNGLEMERRQQAQMNEDTKRLQDQLDQAAKSARERGQKQEADAMERAAQQLKENGAVSNQQQAQGRLDHSDPKSAASPQSKAAAALQKAAQTAADAIKKSDPDSPQAAANRLEQAAEKLRQMAEQQRMIADQVEKNPAADQAKRLAQQEQALEQKAGQAQQSLKNASQAQQSLKNAQQSLSQSGQNLNQNNSQAAKPSARNAQQQLRQAADETARAAQQLRQQQAAAELQEKVENMALTQRALQRFTTAVQARREVRSLMPTENQELQKATAVQERLQSEAEDLVQKFPSEAFRQALRMASRQMKPAVKNLNNNPPITDRGTQVAQSEAADTLEATAQALKKQAQGGKQQDAQQEGDQNSSGSSPEQAQKAEALGELMLGRTLQQQLRQETSRLDLQRGGNRDTPPSKQQQQQIDQLAQSEKDVNNIVQSAEETLRDEAGVSDDIKQAEQQIGQATDRLAQRDTGQPTQGHQDNAIRSLDQAVMKAQQQQEQQQQQQQQQQQAQNGAPMPSPQKGNIPGKRLAPLTKVERGKLNSPIQRAGRGFNSLSPRAQRTLREGQQEHAPAEFAELVSRYYKSLAEKQK